MAKNLLETKTMTLSTTQQVYDDLESLVRTGHWGKSAPEAAERMISHGLRELLKSGELQRKAAKQKV
jgi:hypothetical protein